VVDQHHLAERRDLLVVLELGVALRLYIGNRSYSSWSLRPALALAHAGAAFEVVTIPLDRPETRAAIAAVSPTGRVPVLHDDGLVIWDSLAICEYVAERFPAAGLWPADVAARARARAVAAEMHSGFAALRAAMSMDLRSAHPGVGHTEAALADAARVMAVWREALAASGGPFLFGAFTIADAMYAPVVARFATYGVALDEVCAGYAAAIEGLPAMVAWRAAAIAEPWTLIGH
jgi:glutathione S-transferase